MASYYDRLKAAFEGFEQRTLTSSAQLVYLHILHMDNATGRTGLVECTDSRLETLTNLSKNTITDAKRQLKNLGFLDFHTKRNSPRKGTRYILPELNVEASTEVNTGVNTGVNAGVNTGVNIGGTVINVREEKESEREEKKFTAPAKTRVLSENSYPVKQAWFECEGERLKGGVALGLIELEKEYGTEKIVKAIYTAHQANSQPRLSYNFVKAVLKRLEGLAVEGNEGNAYADAWRFAGELPPAD